MPKIAQLSREQFVAWIGNSFVPAYREASLRELVNSRGPSIALVWPDRGMSLQSDAPIVALPRSQLTEFYAFVSTYISTFQPFTAFFRVIPFETLGYVLADPPRSKNRPQIPTSFVGAIIAEAKLQSGDRSRGLADFSIQACLAASSAPAVSALKAGLGSDALHEIFGNWVGTRRYLTDERLPIEAQRVEDFWRIVFGAFDDVPLLRRSDRISEVMIRFVSSVLSTSDDADALGWDALTEALPKSQSAIGRMKDSREDRVRALDDLRSELLSSDVSVRQREMVLGYLVSRAAGGSLSYFELMRPFEPVLPLSAMWFGLFSSIRQDTDVLVAGDCLGRRLERQLNISNDQPLTRPTADIAFHELQVLFPKGRMELRIRTEHIGAIVVEVFPTVNAVFRLPRENRRETDARRNELPSEVVRELRHLTERFDHLSRRILASQQGEFLSEARTGSPPPQAAASSRRPRPKGGK